MFCRASVQRLGAPTVSETEWQPMRIQSVRRGDEIEGKTPCESVAAGEYTTRLGALARDTHGSLVRFLRARTGSKAEAEDIAQEAYLRILTAESLRSVDSLENYLWRSALNLLTDRRRRRAARVCQARGMWHDEERDAPSTETIMATREDLEMVGHSLDALPPTYRRAFELRLLEGRPFREVGREMGVCERMAKIYVARTLALLRKRLAIADSQARHRG